MRDKINKIKWMERGGEEGKGREERRRNEKLRDERRRGK